MNALRCPQVLVLLLSWSLIFAPFSLDAAAAKAAPVKTSLSFVEDHLQQLKIAEMVATGLTVSLGDDLQAFTQAFMDALSPRLQTYLAYKLPKLLAPDKGAAQQLGGQNLQGPFLGSATLDAPSPNGVGPKPISEDEFMEQLSNPTPEDEAFKVLWPQIAKKRGQLATVEHFIDQTRTLLYEHYRDKNKAPDAGSPFEHIKEFLQLNIHGSIRRMLRESGKTNLPDLAEDPRCDKGLLGSFAFFNALMAEANDSEALLPLIQQHMCQSVTQSLRHEFAYVIGVEREEARLVQYQLAQVYPVVAGMNFPVMLTLWDGKQWMGDTPYFDFFQWNRKILQQKKYQSYGVWVNYGAAEMIWGISFCDKTAQPPMMSLVALAEQVRQPAKKPMATQTRGSIKQLAQPTQSPAKSPPVYLPPQIIDPTKKYTAYGMPWSGNPADLCTAEHIFKVAAYDGETCIDPAIFLDRLTDPHAWAFGNCNLEQFIEQGLRCHQPKPWCENLSTLGITDQANKPTPYTMIMDPKKVAECGIVNTNPGGGSTGKLGQSLQCSGIPMGTGAGGLMASESAGGGGSGGSNSETSVLGSKACGAEHIGGPLDEGGDGGDSGDSGGGDDGDDGGDDDNGDDDGDTDDGNSNGNDNGGQSGSAGNGGSDRTPSQFYDFPDQEIIGHRVKTHGPEGESPRPKQGPEPSGNTPSGGTGAGSTPAGNGPGSSGKGPKEPSPAGTGQSGSGGSNGSPAPGGSASGSAGGGTEITLNKKPGGKGKKIQAPQSASAKHAALKGGDLTPQWLQNELEKNYKGSEEEFREKFREFVEITADKTIHKRNFREQVAELIVQVLEKNNIPVPDPEKTKEDIAAKLFSLVKYNVLPPRTQLSDLNDPKFFPSPMGNSAAVGNAQVQKSSKGQIKSFTPSISMAYAILALADPQEHMELMGTIVHEWLHVVIAMLIVEGAIPPFVATEAPQGTDAGTEPADTIEHMIINTIEGFMDLFIPTNADGSIKSSMAPDPGNGNSFAGGMPDESSTSVTGEVVASVFYGYGPTHMGTETGESEERYPGSAAMCEDPMGCRAFQGCTPPQSQATLNCAANIQQAKWATEVGDPSPMDDPEIPACADDGNTGSNSKCKVIDCPADNPNCCAQGGESGNPYAIDTSLFQMCWAANCGDNQESCPCTGLQLLQGTMLETIGQPLRNNPMQRKNGVDTGGQPRQQMKGPHGR